MKIVNCSVFRSLTILSFALALFSCAGMKRMQENMANSRETDHKAFVEKKDGEIIEANEAKLRSSLFGKSTIELDGEVKIPLKEVAAYQNSYAYYHTTPNGFAPRFKKGLINMYVATQQYTEYESPSMSNANIGGVKTRTRYVYYIQKGKAGGIEVFSPKIVESYVSDYAPAMEFMDVYNETQKKVKRWSLINTAATLGGLVLVGVAGLDKDNNPTAAGYAGTGLFFGGIINGFVNKVRRGKNTVNLELAIDAYNGQVTKKKRG